MRVSRPKLAEKSQMSGVFRRLGAPLSWALWMLRNGFVTADAAIATVSTMRRPIRSALHGK
jgi:hypothetical protein